MEGHGIVSIRINKNGSYYVKLRLHALPLASCRYTVTSNDSFLCKCPNGPFIFMVFPWGYHGALAATQEMIFLRQLPGSCRLPSPCFKDDLGICCFS